MVITSDPSKPNLIFKREQGEFRYFVEELGNGVGLDMTFIPAGTFMMGSPEDEPERLTSEGPQHQVSVQSFFMGTYPITQEQWRVIASFEPVDRELKPEPSHFKGDKHPVEQVSWEDAIECCKRLSHHTKRDYRLPSEAEWEYACRAGTATPFHFGPTITTDYANYCGDGSTGGPPSYGPGYSGSYRAKTIPVDEFYVSNAFGLFNMHGNVWEWCQDPWHESYEGDLPTDGSAWEEGGDGQSPVQEQRTYRVIRGGSWLNNPGNCRSAYRNSQHRAFRLNSFGLRVVVSAPGLSIT